MRLFFLVMFLSGCATVDGKLTIVPLFPTHENYEKKLQTWIGSKENDLVASWGPPASVYQTEEGKFLTFQEFGGTRSTMNPIGNSYYVNTVNNACKTTFFINDLGFVQSWQYEGNMCRSR